MTSSRLLSNRYELGETLGYGGMSEVHRGKDVRLGRDVAVKVLRADLARDPQFQERFRREAQNAAALNHPAIVAVYDTGETRTDYGPLPYIVMEYVDGRTLRDIVKSEGPLPPKRAMEVMADVCAALDFSHRHGIVHRDVKPANIMITKTGAVKVMDFGIARALSDGQAAVTQTAAVIGTAQYLSPEQARGEAVDARSDVYAAGCVLFELLTAEPPFTGDSPVAVAYQHVREDPSPPSSRNQRVPQSLDAIVLKAMAKGPANRYQSSAEMRGDLVRVLSGQRPAAPMVMTDADRTSMMGAGRTEVMTGGRHRPSAIANDYDDYDDYDPDEEAARRRKRNWLIALGVFGAIVLIVLLAILLPKLLGSGDNPNAGKIAVPDVVNQSQAQATQAMVTAKLVPVTKPVTCSPAGTANAQCTTSQVGDVIRTTPGAGTFLATGGQVTLFIGQQAAPVKVPDLSGLSQADAQKALTAAHLTLAPNPGTQPTTDSTKINKVVSQNPPAGNSAPPGTAISITLGVQPQNVGVPDERGKQYNDAKQDLQNQKFGVKEQMQASDKPAGTVIDMNPSAGTQVQPGTTVTLIVSDGSQQQITMPDITNLTKSQAQSKLAGLGWTGNFNTNTTSTFDPSQNGLIKEQNPNNGQQIDKNQTVFITVQQLVGGGPSTSSPGGGGGGGPFGN
jgi:serine/threonine-protein kinase